MNKKFFSLNLDFLGFSASMLCALHCISLPLLLTIGALAGFSWLKDPFTEAIFISLSLTIASWSLVRSYFTHQRWSAIRLVAFGFIFILASRFLSAGWEPTLAMLGGVTIAGAHWKNWLLCKTGDSTAIKN